MSDDLRKVYEGAGPLDRYFDRATPVDLFRGRRQGDSTDVMQPTLVGWYTKTDTRDPDVLVVDDKGNTPQYTNGDLTELVTEGKDKAVTAEIVRNGDKLIVKGCRTMAGHHRGVSVFDKTNPGLRNFDWFKLPAGTELPDAIAVTRDAVFTTSTKPIHYTVAPKDDMPLSLFLQHLKGLAAKAQQQ